MLCFHVIVTITSDYQASLAGCIKSGDLNTFSALLADIAPLDDAKHLSLPDDEKEVQHFTPYFVFFIHLVADVSIT